MDSLLGIYIHIPFCKRKCNYCAFVSVCDFSLQKEYVDSLRSEIRERKVENKVSTVYIGGGTPSTLYKGALTQIINEVKNNYNIVDNAEITAEINPESATEDFLKECKENGVNRISIGLQSSNDDFLKFLGRIHTRSDFEKTIQKVKDVGITNISADLIYGLPNQSVDDVKQDVDFLTACNVSHVSAYALTIEEGTPFYKNNVTVNDDGQALIYDFLVGYLKEKGYCRYEVSNFAKPGFESRHNTKYWFGIEYLGFGVAAHSLFNSERRANVSDICEYVKGNKVDNVIRLTEKDRQEEFIFLRLRTSVGIDLQEYENLFGEDLYKKSKRVIDKYISSDHLQIKNGKLVATDKGIYVLDYILTELI